ncbi:unnamed protein product, partial [Meganyctiphanes norvegica]
MGLRTHFKVHPRNPGAQGVKYFQWWLNSTDRFGYFYEKCIGASHGVGRGQAAPSGRGHMATATGAVGNGRQKKQKNTSNDSQDGERRFAAACKEIQASVDRYMATHQFEESSEEEQEEDVDFEEDTVLDKVYQSYGSDRDMGGTYQYLQDAFKNGALVCLICIENVKKNDAIWNCQGCYSSFHIPCVQKWAKDSIYHQAEAQTENNTHIDRAAFNWFCPKCRAEYQQKSIPTKYACFCGKQTDPVFDPWLVPHSCGNNCGKKLKPECGHVCLLLCHPGPCPPCPKMVSNSCHCGKEKPQPRRCCSKEWSCGKACGHLMTCGHHPCEEACHTGSCKPCPRQSQQSCHCGASTTLRNCAEPEWQCQKVCGKKYSCGHHACKEICHSGSCGDCPASGERKCPCGKTSHSLPCTKEIPNCGDTCDKLMACGVHYCAERCHKGSCTQCLQYRVKRCRCGALEKDMACGKLFTCERKCKRMKDCRRHPCNRKCCTGDCPMCEVPCGRQLGCRNHKCESRCHEGPCYPCPLTFTITCNCGGTKITVPCGREKATAPPKCSKKCKKPPICHHPEQRPHKCHPGACPTCKITCRLELSCGHICQAACHDNVPVKIVDKKKRAGPWERSEGTKIQLQKKPCPPCQVPVRTICRGKHETPNWPCSDIRPLLYSCGRKCGRLLACTNHICERDCHEVRGAMDEKNYGSNCAKCEVPCGKARPNGCTHQCAQPCHTDSCAPCEKTVKIKCHCTLNQLFLKCNKWNGVTVEERDVMKSCKNQCNKTMPFQH